MLLLFAAKIKPNTAIFFAGNGVGAAVLRDAAGMVLRFRTADAACCW
jgi:hypothetical protein